MNFKLHSYTFEPRKEYIYVEIPIERDCQDVFIRIDNESKSEHPIVYKGHIFYGAPGIGAYNNETGFSAIGFTLANRPENSDWSSYTRTNLPGPDANLYRWSRYKIVDEKGDDNPGIMTVILKPAFRDDFIDDDIDGLKGCWDFPVKVLVAKQLVDT